MTRYVPVCARRPWPAALLLVWVWGWQGACAQAPPPDPLPSWNDGAAKSAVAEFVGRVTQEGGADFVPVDQRIATFDHDGTLWAEQPIYLQIAFAMDRVKALAAQHPEWRHTQPFEVVIEGDLAVLAASGEKEAEVEFIDDGPAKPVGINRFIGRRPIMAFGNSDGDLQMLQGTTARDGPRFGLIVHHTDGTREWAYDRKSHIGRLDEAPDAAGPAGGVVVSMKDDWRTIFAEQPK